MKRGLAVFLQLLILLVGVGAVTFLLIEPQFEGRNVGATFSQIYFQDPFLAYAYVASFSFFAALYQIARVVGYAGRGELGSRGAVWALKAMKYCAFAMIAFVVGGEIFIFSTPSDDRAGGVVMGIIIAAVALVTAGTAARLEQRANRGRT